MSNRSPKRIFTHKRSIILLLSIACLGFPIRVAAAPCLAAADLAALEEAVGDESAPLLPVVHRLRVFALIVMGIALSIAALLAAWGRTGTAIGVGLGTLVLSGGIWIVSLLWQPFGKTPERFPGRSGEYADIHGEEGRSGLDRLVRKIGRECVQIMARGITPFILIQGIWIALAAPVTGVTEDVLSRFLLGSLLAFSSAMLGHLFLFAF